MGVLAVLAVAVLAAAAWRPHATGGWILALAGAAVLMADTRLRGGPTLVLVLALWALRQAVAVSDAWTRWFSDTQIDAMAFAHSASVLAVKGEFSLLSMGSDFYQGLLGTVMAVAGTHPLVGNELSVFAFCLSVPLMLRLLGEAAGARLDWVPLALFALIPSSVLLHSVTLREPFQLLFLMLTAWLAIRARHGSPWYTVAAVAAAFGAALFHQVLLLAALPMLLVIMLWPHGTGGNDRRWLPAALVAAGGGVAVLVAWLIPVAADDDYLRRIAGGPVEALLRYRGGIESASPRTAWGVTFPPDSFPALLRAVLANYAMYLVAPLPWWVQDVRDAYAAAEALLRTALVLLALGLGVRAGGERLRTVLLWLALYVVITATWSLGTTNWGQALRHHTVSNWMLIIAAWAALGGVAGRARPSAAPSVPVAAQPDPAP